MNTSGQDDMKVSRILWRRITPSDYYNTEKDLPKGPKGQIHIDLPTPGPVVEFLKDIDNPYENEDEKYSRKLSDVKVIGDSSLSDNLVINHRGRGRWGIARQNINGVEGSRRHPAWDTKWGWPRNSVKAPVNTNEAEDIISSVDGITVYVVRTIDDQFFAGMVTGNVLPSDWPEILRPLFEDNKKKTGCITVSEQAPLSPLARTIIKSFKRKKNVLLYGPPGSGKTRAVAEIYQYLNSSNNAGLRLDPDDSNSPFSASEEVELLDRPVNTKWTTFHQEYGYEDFIIGLRPTGNGLELEPVAGRLIDLAYSIDKGEYRSGVLIIDEINRGNVPKILGEFITYMDDDYRAGESTAIPIALPKLLGDSDDPSFTQEIVLEDGRREGLRRPWFFPQNIYIVATMNSVDRSVAPLDSALGRRFTRVDARCDLELLARELGVDYSLLLSDFSSAVKKQYAQPQDDSGFVDIEGDDLSNGDEEVESNELGHHDSNSTKWSPQYAAVAMLHYLNSEIVKVAGPDYELGHSYFFGIDSWEDLGLVWDFDIWPQLRDRFGSRPKVLSDVLRVNHNDAPSGYPFYKVSQRSAHFEVEQLSSMDSLSLRRVISFLCFGS